MAVSPTGPAGAQPPIDPNQDQNQQQSTHRVLGMEMNKKQYHEFLKNLMNQISHQIKHDMARMKKLYQERETAPSRAGKLLH